MSSAYDSPIERWYSLLELLALSHYTFYNYDMQFRNKKAELGMLVS